MVLNIAVGEDYWESLEVKEIKLVNSKGNQPWIFIERLMLKMKFQYFFHLMWRVDSLEKILMLGKIEGRRRRGWQRARQLEGTIDSMDINLSKLWKRVKAREAWSSAVHGIAKSWKRLNDWTTATFITILLYFYQLNMD